MFTFRPTARLTERLGAMPVPHEQPTTTRLGDWYGNLVRFGRQQMILCTSDRSLLSVVLPAKDVRHSLPLALPGAVGSLLHGLGVPATQVRAELEAMRDVTIGKTVSRSVLGSMNDFVFAIQCRLDDEPAVPFDELASWLSETPCSPLGYDSPRSAATRLLA